MSFDFIGYTRDAEIESLSDIRRKESILLWMFGTSTPDSMNTTTSPTKRRHRAEISIHI